VELRQEIVFEVKFFPSSELTRFLQSLKDDPRLDIRRYVPDMPTIYPIYDKDKQALSILPQYKDRIKISKKIFRVYKHPEENNKIIFVSRDSAFVYKEGEREMTFVFLNFTK
jgi:hypothetical protein